MEAIRTNYPAFDRNMSDSFKYNTLMGRDVPTGPWDHFARYENCPNFVAGDNKFENRMYPYGFERNNWNNMPYGMERNWYNMPYGMERNWFNMPWFNNFENRMLPYGMERNLFNMPWLNKYFHNHEHQFDFLDNWTNVSFRPSHPHEYYTLNHPIRVLDRDGNRELFLCFHLSGFKSEEITCTFDRKERCIIVEATHDIKDGKEHAVMRKYYRKYALPASLAKVDLTKCELKTCFSNDGHLHIELPLPKLTTEELSKCPVMTKSVTSPYSMFYGCPSNCNTTPINCKLI